MVKLPLYSIYIIYTGILALVARVFVPLNQIRKLAFWGLIFGAVVDFFMIIIFSHILGAGGHKNYGPFTFMGIPFFPLLAWTFYFITYLYLLPKLKPYNYAFSIVTAGYSTLFSNILQNLDIFKWNYGRLVLPFFIYLFWNLSVTWTYQKFFQGKELY